MADKLNSYTLTRNWFDFAGKNPEKLTPAHTAMYLYLVDLNNSLGWAEKFFAPAKQTMHFISLKSYNTYSKVFNDLVDFGFIKVLVKSKNQYQANLIALSNFDKALNKAKDRHLIKQRISTVQSIDSINKHINYKTIKTNKNSIYIKDVDVENILKVEEPIWIQSVANKIGLTISEAENYFREFFKEQELDGQESITKSHFRRWSTKHRLKQNIDKKLNKPSKEL